MTPTFTVTIATPERQVLSEEVTGLSVPTTDGEITIMARHLPLVTTLKAGEVVLRHEDEEKPYAIGGGFLEMDGQKVTILADTAEHVTELDEQRVQEAISRAERLRDEQGADHVEFASLAGKLERDLARMKVIRKHRHQGHHGIPYEGTRKD